MTDVPAPRATRLRPPSWRDTRLLIGVVLVLASVVLGATVVAAADETVPVWAADRDVVAGEVLDADSVRAVRVRLDDVGSGYLPATEDLPADALAVRSIGAGELVPRSALGDSGDLDRAPVTLPLPRTEVTGVARGDHVDVWVSQQTDGSRRFAEPVRLARGAEVVEVTGTETGFGPGAEQGARVLLKEDELRLVLDALANEDRVALVGVVGPVTTGTDPFGAPVGQSSGDDDPTTDEAASQDAGSTPSRTSGPAEASDPAATDGAG